MLARTQVRAALSAKLTTLGLKVLEFRDEDDAISPADFPAALIQQAGAIEISRLEGEAGGGCYHTGNFFLSFVAENRESSEAMLVNAANSFATDWTLGGKVMNIQPVSYGDEEDDGRDFKATMLEIRVMWVTAADDWANLLP